MKSNTAARQLDLIPGNCRSKLNGVLEVDPEYDMHVKTELSYARATRLLSI